MGWVIVIGIFSVTNLLWRMIISVGMTLEMILETSKFGLRPIKFFLSIVAIHSPVLSLASITTSKSLEVSSSKASFIPMTVNETRLLKRPLTCIPSMVFPGDKWMTRTDKSERILVAVIEWCTMIQMIIARMQEINFLGQFLMKRRWSKLFMS